MKKEKVSIAFDGARGDQSLSARVTVDMPLSSVAGYTMLELMVTIVILCILIGLAIPGFSRWLPNYRLRGAARGIYSNFQLAKMTAVKDRKRCGVLFDLTGGGSYRIVSSSNTTFGDSDDRTLKTVSFSEYGSGVGYGHPTTATGGVEGEGAPFDDNVTFVENGIVFDSRGMVFTPSGAAAGADGYVYLQNNRNNSYAVGVGSSGLIVMRRFITGSTWQQ